MPGIEPVVMMGARDGAHPSWSAPIPDADPRIEAICRRFCAMAGLAPDEVVEGNGGRGRRGHRVPRWRNYRLGAAQWLAAADAADPLRQSKERP